MDGLLASGALSHDIIHANRKDGYLATETQSPTIGALVSQIVQVLVVDANLHIYVSASARTCSDDVGTYHINGLETECSRGDR
jgi:hypothetical protein